MVSGSAFVILRRLPAFLDIGFPFNTTSGLEAVHTRADDGGHPLLFPRARSSTEDRQAPPIQRYDNSKAAGSVHHYLWFQKHPYIFIKKTLYQFSEMSLSVLLLGSTVSWKYISILFSSASAHLFYSPASVPAIFLIVRPIARILTVNP